MRIMSSAERRVKSDNNNSVRCRVDNYGSGCPDNGWLTYLMGDEGCE